MGSRSELIPKPSPYAAYRVIDGEAVIITIADSRQHTLNATGTFIWSLLEEGVLTVGQIAVMVHMEFCVDERDALEDVIQFTDDLVEKGMVVLTHTNHGEQQQVEP